MARPTNALIVDDEPHARKYVRTLLHELGIEQCWEAGEGAEALALCDEHRPELVILDLNLRLMTGLEVLTRIRDGGGTMPIVMMTSESAVKSVGEAARLGADGYILKHSPRDQALKNLREVLDAEPADDDPSADLAPPLA